MLPLNEIPFLFRVKLYLNWFNNNALNIHSHPITFHSQNLGKIIYHNDRCVYLAALCWIARFEGEILTEGIKSTGKWRGAPFFASRWTRRLCRWLHEQTAGGETNGSGRLSDFYKHISYGPLAFPRKKGSKAPKSVSFSTLNSGALCHLRPGLSCCCCCWGEQGKSYIVAKSPSGNITL